MFGVTFSEAAPAKDSHKKDKKQHKKEKKRKSKEKKHITAKGSASSEDEGKAGVGTPGSPQEQEAAAPVQREAWMTQPLARPHAIDTAAEEEAARQQAQQQQAAAEPEVVVGLRVMKPGGGNPHAASSTVGQLAGRPPSAAAAAAAADSDTAAGAAAAATSSGNTSGGGGGSGGRVSGAVGDGGLSWRLKALKRAQQQATASGQEVGLLVSQRWGSLQSLTSSLTEGRAADSNAHAHSARQRDRERASSATPSTNSGKPHYLADFKGDRSKPQMRRPVMDDGLRWKRRDSGRDSGRESSADLGERERSERSAGTGSAGMDRDRERLSPIVEGPGDSQGPMAVDQPAPASSTGGVPRDRTDDQALRSKSRFSHQDDGRQDDDRGERRPDRERHGSRRDDDRYRDSSGSRHASQHQHRHQRHEGGRGRPDRASGTGAATMSAEQQAALQSVAASLNKHASDGSFMEQFQQQHQAAEGDRGRQGRGGGRHAQQRSSVADDMREEMKRLRQGFGGDGGDDADGGGSGADEAGAGKHGLLEEAGTSSDSNGGVAGGSGEDSDVSGEQKVRGRRHHRRDDGSDSSEGEQRQRKQSKHRRDSGKQQAKEEYVPPTTATANKSAAEMLRARLKGLPVPSLPAAAHQQEAGARGGPRDGQQHSRSPSPSGSEDGHHDQRNGSKSRREVVALPLVEATGRASRGAFGRESAGSAAAAGPGGRGVKRVQRYDESGSKVRYFADDDADLDTLVKRTKHGDDANEQVDHNAAHNIMRRSRFKEKEMDVDDEYDYDGGMELYESRAKKGNAEQQAARDRARQVAAYNRAQRAEQQCIYCTNSPNRPAQLTISVAPTTYLMLPPRGRLVPGHCCIVPKDHTPSLRLVDDNVWTEVKNFIKCLIQMFGTQGKSVLFWETATALGGNKRHAVLEAVPVSQAEVDKAPAYFKKAMQDAESEWSTHAAKAVIETNAKKGLRESIPPNFPYVYVQFGYGRGFVHVIDDERKFDTQMARQVVVGLLRLPAEAMHQRGKVESAATQQQWARDFVSTWAAFDWTLQL